MFLLFAYFFYYFPPLPALCMEIRVWIFSSRLPASDCRKEKKKTGNRSLARYYCAVVCMLVVESYIILFRFFPFLVLLYSSRDAASLPMCECIRNCYAFTTYCCFSSLFLFSTDLVIVWVEHAVLLFASLLSGEPFDFSLFFPMHVKSKNILIWKTSFVYVM